MALRSDKAFFGLPLYLVGKHSENPNVPGTQLNVNLALPITCFEDVTICYVFFNNNSPPPRQFLRNIILLKTNSYKRGMLIEQIFELRGPGPRGVYVIL